MVLLAPWLVLALAPAQDDYQALFVNGGFEQGLDGWRALNMSGACEHSVVDQHHGGSHALRITRGEGARPDWLKQNGDLPSDTGTVLLRLWYRSDGPGAARVTGYFWDAGGNTLGDQRLVVDITPTVDWTEARQGWEVPQGAVGFGINVRSTTSGTLLLDDVVAEYRPGEPRPARPSLVLANPGFDLGLDGWTGIRESRTSAPYWNEREKAVVVQRTSRRLYPEDGVETEAELGAGEQRVRGRVRVRREAAARARITLQARSRSGAVLASARSELREGKRATLEVELEVPRGTARIAVLLTTGGRGEVSFDDVELEAAE